MEKGDVQDARSLSLPQHILIL